MKIRIFTTTITILAALMAVWCVIPPENTLDIKIGLTIGGILVCVVAYFGGRKISQCAITIVHSGNNLLRRFLCSLEYLANAFVAWSVEADLTAVTAKRNHLFEAKQTKPIRRVVSWTDTTAICSCVGFIVLGVISFHDHNLAELVVLNVASFVIISLMAIIIDISTMFTYDGTYHARLDAIIAVVAIVIQFFVLLIQMVVALCNYVLVQEIPEPLEIGPAYLPFFTVRLSFVNFTLTPLQAVAIVCAILFLFCYGQLCAAVHRLSNYPEK